MTMSRSIGASRCFVRAGEEIYLIWVRWTISRSKTFSHLLVHRLKLCTIFGPGKLYARSHMYQLGFVLHLARVGLGIC
jgi:hypothetical protein